MVAEDLSSLAICLKCFVLANAGRSLFLVPAFVLNFLSAVVVVFGVARAWGSATAVHDGNPLPHLAVVAAALA